MRPAVFDSLAVEVGVGLGNRAIEQLLHRRVAIHDPFAERAVAQDNGHGRVPLVVERNHVPGFHQGIAVVLHALVMVEQQEQVRLSDFFFLALGGELFMEHSQRAHAEAGFRQPKSADKQVFPVNFRHVSLIAHHHGPVEIQPHPDEKPDVVLAFDQGQDDLERNGQRGRKHARAEQLQNAAVDVFADLVVHFDDAVKRVGIEVGGHEGNHAALAEFGLHQLMDREGNLGEKPLQSPQALDHQFRPVLAADGLLAELRADGRQTLDKVRRLGQVVYQKIAVLVLEVARKNSLDVYSGTDVVSVKMKDRMEEVHGSRRHNRADQIRNDSQM